jgi:hypothetical protein
MNTPQVIWFEFPGLPNIRCAFQTRQGGFSVAPYNDGNISLTVGDEAKAVIQNREALLKTLGVSTWSEEDQVHGDGVILDAPATPLDKAGTSQADGLTTAQSDLALCIKTADCQPIMLAHKSGQYVAALHVGWRGNRINFPYSGTTAFCKHYGLDPADVIAVRGPSLEPAVAEFINFDTEWGDEFLPWYDPATRGMNLWALTQHQLQAVGLKPENIHSIDLCTYTRADLFYSFRRDGAHSGRQASCVWIAKA